MRNKIIQWTAVILTLVILVSGLPTVAASAEAPSYAVQWPGFRGGDGNNAVTASKTPRTAAEAALKWALALKSPTDWDTAMSDPVMVGGQIYVAVGNELRILDSAGKQVKKAMLAGVIEYTCRPVYAQGKIIVPLSGGRAQAFEAGTLTAAWITPVLPAVEKDGLTYEHQPLTTLTASGGYVYLGTACADWVQSYYGVYQCIDASTGEVVWQHENQNAGYYWGGAVCVGDAVLVAGDDGILQSLSAHTGAEIAALDLGAPVRATLVKNGNQVLAVSTIGVLHTVDVGQDGSFGVHRRVSFAAASTTTPAVQGGKAVVGGHLGEAKSYQGVLCVIDLSAMAVTQTVSAPAEVKASPLLSTGYSGETYAYYTCNTTPGGLYVQKLGAAGTQAKSLYTPIGDGQNYCMTSVMAGGDGTLYYTNDSGRLFAVGTIPVQPSITLDKKAVSLLRAQTVTLKAVVAPASLPDKTVTWKSSDTSVATVSTSGKVTAKRPGTAKITASSNGKSEVCTVTVQAYVILRLGCAKAVADGKTVSIDAKGTRPITKNGRTMVPLRFVEERMGAKVTYVSDAKPITVTYDGTVVEYRLNSKSMKVIQGGKTRTVTLDAPVQKVGGRTLVPTRASGEALGYHVYYDAKTKLVVVHNPRMTAGVLNARLREGAAKLKAL